MDTRRRLRRCAAVVMMSLALSGCANFPPGGYGGMDYAPLDGWYGWYAGPGEFAGRYRHNGWGWYHGSAAGHAGFSRGFGGRGGFGGHGGGHGGR